MVDQLVNNPHAVEEIWGQFLSRKDPVEKEIATYSTQHIPAWKISWTEESGGIQFMASQESDMT